MAVVRSLAMATIMGVLCEGQPMMRKRVVSPVIEIADLNPHSTIEETGFYLTSSEQNRGLGSTGGGGEHKEEKYIKQTKGAKKSEKSDKAFKNGKNREKDFGDYDFSNMVSMVMSMSMPSKTSSPVANPTNKPTSDTSKAPITTPPKTSAPIASITTPEPVSPTPVPVTIPVPTPTEAPVPENEPTPAPVLPRTLSPTQGSACESLSREQVLKETLEKVTEASILEDPSTPQGKSWFWLLETDPAQIDPCNYATVEQRYALATFYHSTNGDDWDDSEGWLVDSSECSWVGVKCDDDGLVDELGADEKLSK